MKRFTRISMVVTLALMILLASVPMAFAAEGVQYTSLADELKALGLFQGTEKGYELDRAATRTEASVMLVRLLGKEAEAKAGDYTTPFTDVAAWAKPYVGYMYEAGLTKGVSEDTFGSSTLCDAKMYSTFLLRSLGYSEADGDFTYNDAVEFASEKGIMDPSLAKADFLRDQVAAASYNALSAQVKGTENCLLKKLVDDGAVTAEAAKPMLDKIAAFNSYMKVGEAMGQDAYSMDISATTKITMTMEGQTIEMPTTMDAKVKITDAAIEMAMTQKSTIDGQEMNVSTYMKDGIIYMNDGTNKIKMSDASEGISIPSLDQYAAKVGNTVYLLNDISMKTSGTDTIYSIDFSAAAMNEIITSVLGPMVEQLETTPQVNSYIVEMTADKDNMMKSMKGTIKMTVEGAEMIMEMDMKVNAIGDKVTITFPDFTDYVETK